MTARRIVPQPGDRWLLCEGGRCWALPADLGRRVRDGDPPPGLDAALAAAPPAAAARSLWLGLPLVPARVAASVAAALAPAASWAGLAAAAVLGAFGYALAGPPALDGVRWPVAAAGLLAAGLVHELGHAAALARGGLRPGPIGVGALLVFPVLFCDVTAAALLPRSARLRVDVAGAAWHLAAGGALAVAGRASATPGLTVAAWGALAAVVWSALPFLRTDGYWALCDGLGLAALEPPAPRGTGRGVRAALLAWRAGSLAFLAALGAALGGRGVWLARASEGWESPWRIAVLAATAGLGIVLAVGLGRRIVTLVRSLGRDVLAVYIQCRYNA